MYNIQVHVPYVKQQYIYRKWIIILLPTLNSISPSPHPGPQLTHTHTHARARTHTHTHEHSRALAQAHTHTHTNMKQICIVSIIMIMKIAILINYWLTKMLRSTFANKTSSCAMDWTSVVKQWLPGLPHKTLYQLCPINQQDVKLCYGLDKRCEAMTARSAS